MQFPLTPSRFQTQPALTQRPQKSTCIIVFTFQTAFFLCSIELLPPLSHVKIFYFKIFKLLHLDFSAFHDSDLLFSTVFCGNFTTSTLFKFYHLYFVPTLSSLFCSNFTNFQNYTIQYYTIQFIIYNPTKRPEPRRTKIMLKEQTILIKTNSNENRTNKRKEPTRKQENSYGTRNNKHTELVE